MRSSAGSNASEPVPCSWTGSPSTPQHTRSVRPSLALTSKVVGQDADKAVLESVFATLKTELLDSHDWPTRDRKPLAVYEDRFTPVSLPEPERPT